MIPHLLFSGPPGVGKTTAAQILVSSIDCSLLLLNASAERGVDTIRSEVARFLRTESLLGRRWKVVVLDESDGLTPEAQDALRNLMERHVARGRFILTSNHIDRLATPLRSRCVRLDMSVIPLDQRYRRLSCVLEAEGFEARDSDVRAFVARYTDLRQMLLAAQQSFQIHGRLVLELESDSNCQHLTDLGNARRLVDSHGRDLRWVPTIGWLVWDGRRWERDETKEVERRAKDVIASLWELAEQVDDADEADILRDFAGRSEQGPRLREIEKLAQSEPTIPLRVDDLDSDPWLLNVRNGTLDLRTGELREHGRHDLITKIAPVDYAPDAPAARWSAFLDEIFEGNTELIGYVQRAVGYSITGLTSEQVLFIAYGTGANGKSTLLEAIRASLGDYAQQAPPDLLAARRFGGIPNDIARVRGARFVTSVELEQGAKLAESLVKVLTGGDTVAARFLYREFFEFRPVGKFWVGTNHKPKVRGSNYAIWRRIRLIPFSVRIPPAKQDRQLLGKLRLELPGILAWAVQGCLEWQREGLGDPEEVREATEEYREEMDPVGRFLAELCVMEDRAACDATPLHRRFVHWAEQAKEEVLSQTAFGRELSERGFARDNKGEGGRTRYRGLRLKEGTLGTV
jgi:putative DNA primase/helicase